MESGLRGESVAGVVAGALATDDDDRYEAALDELRRRDDAETFQVCAALVEGDDVPAAVFALGVLGQLGFERGRPWLEETLPVVFGASATSDAEVTEAAMIALGQLGDDRALACVLDHLHHDDPRVRWAVAYTLANTGGDPVGPAAVAGLICLMGDDDSEVRDWATFGLGVLTEADGADVRQALTERLDDPEGDTAGEALVGLARRRDSSALPIVLRWLAHADVGNLIVEAAEELADPRLVPALEALQPTGWSENDARGSVLASALDACRNAESPPNVRPESRA